MRRADALIVGGGPAGAAAAIALARGGTRPLLLERTRAPHDIVCGGFLGGDALAALGRLGIDAAALGGRTIGRVRLIAGGRQAEAALPFAAMGLSRRTLDAALLDAAARAGAGIERGITVRGGEGPPWRLRLGDGAGIEAEALFLATGKHDLRGLARETDRPVSIGLRTGLAPTAPLARALDGVIELHLFAGGYAGLLIQDDGTVNFCLSATRARLAAAGGEVPALIAALGGEAPLLGERIAAATGVPIWSAIGAVPYGWRARTGVPGLFRLGDQAAVIASLAGDGVAIALGSGLAAADAYRRGGASGSLHYQADFTASARRPLGIAGALRRLAEGRAGPFLPFLARLPGLVPLLARLTRIGG